MKAIIHYITVILLLFCTYTSLFGQLQKTEQFEINDFLGEREFKSATQSDNLLIYFNTSRGILSYDGHDFKKIDVNINADEINDIQTFQNTLFIASESSLIQYFPEKDSTVNVSNINVRQFQEYNNQLWLISESELFVWENDKLKKVFESEKGEKFLSFDLNNNNIFVGHNQGITILEKGEKLKTFASYLKPSKIYTVDSITYISSGNSVFELKNGKVVRTFENNTPVIDFYVDDFGKTWFIENQNVLKINDLIETKPLYYEGRGKLITGKKIFPDKENNLWILGENSLFKISQNNPFSKLFENNALGIYVGKNSNLIIKPEEIIIYNLLTEDKKIEIPNFATPLTEHYALMTEEGWIITLNGSIYSFSNNSNSFNLISSAANYTPVKKVSKSRYLAKNEAGDLFFTDNSFSPVKKLKNISSSEKLVLGQQKIYAFGKNNTIATLDSAGNVLNEISLADSIKIENVIPAKTGFWYYTLTNIYKINSEGTIQDAYYNRSENKLILNAFDDNEDNLWVSSEDHLIRFPVTNNNGKVTLQNSVLYSKNDFLFSTYFKDVAKDASGLIWFVNENGISIYNPLKEVPNLVAPSIKIEEAFAYRIDDFNNPTDTVYLDSKNKNISNNSIVVIKPKVINHFNNSKSSVGYRNLSINQSERRIGSDQKIILTELTDGLNAINIKAYNSNGIASNNEVNINMYVSPPIWKRNWFYLTSIFSLIFLGFIGYRTVISIKNSRARELEDELQKGLEDLEKKSHLQVLKAERLKQLNELITSQKSELEKKNKQIESQKYELSLTNQQIKKQKDLLEETSSKLTSSINYAKRIQNALMSTEVEIKKAFNESFVYFLPRDVVSGDFFWFDKTTNDKGEELLILAAVDCTGHGVPGAIVSVVGMNLLNNITKLKKIYDPGQILTEMNQDIISDLRQDETQVNDGMDMTIVTFNTVTKQLYFAGAKNPLMYVEDGELIRIKGDKYAIGGQQRGDDRVFNTHQLDLSDGKKRSFYLFSDGYQDQFGGEKGFKYLVGNFKKLLLSISDKDVLEQKTILHEEIEDWKDGYAQTDDILVMGFKI